MNYRSICCLAVMLLAASVSISQEQMEVDGAIIIQEAQQTFDPAEGTIRFNPETNDFEGFNGFYWTSLTGVQYEVGSVTDADGNSYKTVKIGNQEWMAENLRTTRYHNASNTPITFVDNSLAGNTEWTNANYGAYAVYDTTGTGYPVFSVDKFGHLYNWYAVDDARGLCPAGWHVPTDAEWTELIDYLDPAVVDPNIDGNQSLVVGPSLATVGLREEGTGLWDDRGLIYTNTSGFSATPSGVRSSSDGLFDDIGDYALFWSATQAPTTDFAWIRRIWSVDATVRRSDIQKEFGGVVRCLQN